MKERPIIFSGEMVRAILDGKKTQTRRVIKLLPKSNEKIYTKCCPYGKPGDRLWVRETFQADEIAMKYKIKEKIFYKATMPNGLQHLRSSIYMPRWASRIDLEIAGIRIERIQDITPADALVEGIKYERHGKGLGDACDEIRILQAFQKLWDSINAKRGYGWDRNPWVWIIEFKVI